MTLDALSEGMRRALGLGGVLLATLAGMAAVRLIASVADADAKKRPTAKFKLSVNGSQETTSRFELEETAPGGGLEEPREGRCISTVTEEVNFATLQPLKVTAARVTPHGLEGLHFNFGKVPENGFGDPIFDVEATVRRSGNDSAECSLGWSAEFSCERTVKVSWPLAIFGNYGEDELIIESRGETDPIGEACPAAGGTFFPELLGSENAQNPVIGPLSRKAVLRKKGRKTFTVHGQGSGWYDTRRGGEGERTDTTTSWTVELKRIK